MPIWFIGDVCNFLRLMNKSTVTVITFFAGCLFTHLAAAQTTTHQTIDHAIKLSVGYLEQSCGSDGKFVYKTAIGFNAIQPESYNIIRHAGVIYALGLANQSHPDPHVVQTMVRAAGYMLRTYVGTGPKAGQLVVWEKPLGASHNYAVLGGTGLGLVALIAIHRVDHQTISLSDLQAMGQFLLFLQRMDGSFVNKYVMDDGTATDEEGLYYTSEAALGLVNLYELDHSTKWLNAAAKALSYLVKSRAKFPTPPADHWELIATARFLPYSKLVQSAAEADTLVQYAIQICNSFLDEQLIGRVPVGLDGAIDPTGRTTPVATRLEGLLAALEFLPKGELHSDIETTIVRGTAFLLRNQITSGPQAGGMPGSIIVGAKDWDVIRMDYVQHALTVWVLQQ